MKKVIENSIWSVALIAMLSTSACSTMSRKRNEDAFGQVKSAAITAYIVKAQASNQLGVSLNTGAMAAQRGGTSFYRKSEGSDLILDDFRKALAHMTNWAVVSPAKTVVDPLYAKRSLQLMPAIQIAYLPPTGENWFIFDKMLPVKGAAMLDRDARNQLMASLGVDALVYLEVKVTSESNFFLMGFGPHHPVSEMTMTVYKRDLDQPIWTEWIEGPKSEESTGITGYMDEDELMKLARKSADAAFARIGTAIE